MAQIQILTPDGQGRGALPVAGTQVIVGDQKLERVHSLQLSADPGAPWILTVKVHVDPATLFGTVPREESRYEVFGEQVR